MIRSDQFDDVYFSADGGMAETAHVFLDGNNLPHAWDGKPSFTIAESGFGTGLNFLCAWKLFEETTTRDQKLHFISFEKYPLSKDQIREALIQWYDVLGKYTDRYLELYPLRVPGPHKIHLNDRVTLTLWIGDVHDVVPEWSGGQVDAWFLDGFTPSKNPDMWNDTLYSNMARLSHDQTSYATFTAAGDVRRGLEATGFSVEKVKGFGRKRDMIKGQYLGDKKTGIVSSSFSPSPSVAIIGGGLAGCAIAHAVKRAGWHATIYETGETLAFGASGGKLGMINPKLTAKPSAQATYYGCAYANVLRQLMDFDNVDFNIHGSRHLCIDADKDRRFTGYIKNLGWHGDHIARDGDNLYYPDGATVSPEKLCHAMAENVDVQLNSKINNLSDLQADYIVLANGYAVNELLLDNLPVQGVRGQVSWIRPQPDIDQNKCFGGYITPKTGDGFHILGSSFQPWETSIEVRDSDHQENLDRYNQTFSESLSINDDVVGGWAAIRTASKDRFPIVGHGHDNIYISTAHGSHGIISSMMAADIIISQIMGDMIPASQAVLNALSPKRFHKR